MALHDRALVGAARRQQARIEAQLGSRFGAISPELRRWAVALALTTTLTLTLILTLALEQPDAISLGRTLTLTLTRWDTNRSMLEGAYLSIMTALIAVSAVEHTNPTRNPNPNPNPNS